MCQNKTLHILVAGEDEDPKVDLDARDPGDAPPTMAPTMDNQISQMEFSMFALGGISGPRKMKLCDKLTRLEVITMRQTHKIRGLGDDG